MLLLCLINELILMFGTDQRSPLNFNQKRASDQRISSKVISHTLNAIMTAVLGTNFKVLLQSFPPKLPALI